MLGLFSFLSVFRRTPEISCWRKKAKNWTEVLKLLKEMHKEKILDKTIVRDVSIELLDDGYELHIHTFVDLSQLEDKK